MDLNYYKLLLAFKTKFFSVAFLVGALLFVASCGSGEVDVKPFKFAYLADIHVDGGESNIADLEASVADINSLDNIDFVILAGDITEFGSDQEIINAKEAIDKLDIPYYIVAGNHDSKWSESGCNTFAQVFGYEEFEFDFNGVKFLGTNSGPNMRMAPALVPRESMVWLDSVSQAVPKDMPVIFVNHYPLDNAMLNYKDVLGYLGRMNTQLSMCGHGHNNNALDFSGLRGVMGRSNLRKGAKAKGLSGYNIVTIAGDSLFVAERSGGGVMGEPWTTAQPWFKMELFSRANNPFVGENALATSAVSNAEQLSSTQGESSATPYLKTIWEFQDNSDIGSAPAMAFGLVYISNSAGYIKALDATKGSLIWEYKTGGKIFSSPAVHEPSGILVVGSSDNNIYGLDAGTGQLRWKVAAQKSVLGSPTIFNNTVYIGASDGIFRALDVVTGNLVWSYNKIEGFIESKPWVDSEGVYVGDWANQVYSFDPISGELQWQWTNNKGRGYSAAAVWPVKANGKIFIVTPERKAYALDAATGKQLWEARGGREAIGLSESGNAVYVKTMQDTVIAFSTESYTKARWSRATSSSTFGEPIKIWETHAGYGYEIAPSPITAANGLVFIPTDKGNIFALNATDGSLAWKHNFSIALINYIRPVNTSELLVTSMDGKVALFSYAF